MGETVATVVTKLSPVRPLTVPSLGVTFTLNWSPAAKVTVLSVSVGAVAGNRRAVVIPLIGVGQRGSTGDRSKSAWPSTLSRRRRPVR